MKFKKELFYGIEAVKNKKIIPFTWDTETAGLGGELLCISSSTDTEEFYVDDDDAEIMVGKFIDFIFKRPTGNMKLSKDGEFLYPKFEDNCYIYYAHNAQYDIRYIVKYLVDNNYKIKFSMRTDVDIYQVVIYKTEKAGSPFVAIRDSFALYPSSLEDFTKQFSPNSQKLTGAIDHENGELFDKTNPVHVQYAKQDATSLRLALLYYFEVLLTDFKVTPGATAAGTALRAWQMTYDGKIFSSTKRQEDFFREGYFGGLVFLTTTENIKNAECYDINSSYPAHMRSCGVPYGKPYYVNKYISSAKNPGIFRLIIKTPDDIRIPIIPSRTRDGSISWGCGEFETVVTNYEIDFALEHGYEIVKIIGGYVWEKVFYPFSDFVDKCEKLRTAHKKTEREVVVKLMQNSVYGKFGTDRHRKDVYHPRYGETPTGTPLLGILDNSTCDAYFYVRDTYTEDMLCKVEFAVFTTAQARITLLRGAYNIGVVNVIYGDTDSLTVRKGTAVNKLDIGTAYGQFKLEKIWKNFKATAPKTYAGEFQAAYCKKDKNGKTIKFHGAVKGLSKRSMTQTKWKELLKLGATEVNYNSLDNLLKTIKTGTINKSSVLCRKSSDLKNSKHYYSMGKEVYPKRAGG